MLKKKVQSSKATSIAILNTTKGKESQLSISFISEISSKIVPRSVLEKIPKEEQTVSTGQVASITNIVRHPNLLMASRMKLSLLERRVFFLVLREIKSIQKRFPSEIEPFTEMIFQIHHKEVTSTEEISKSFRDSIIDIKKRSIEWQDREGNRVSDVIFIRSFFKDGSIHLMLNYKLFPLFLDLSKGYTDYELDYAMALTSEYAQVLYPEFSRMAFRSEWRVSLDEFRTLIGIGKDQYPLFADLKKRAIDPAVNQINTLTDLVIDYSMIRTSRAYTGLIFKIKRQGKLQTSDELAEKRDRINESLKQIFALPFEKLVVIAADILINQYPSFNEKQRRSILTTPNLLEAFIRADNYAKNIETVRDHQAYVAEAVFGYKKNKKRQQS